MSLSTGAKIAIGIGVTLGVLIVGSVVWGAVWLNRQGGLEGLAGKAEDTMRQGQAYARDGHPQSECLPGALDAIEGCAGFKCAISAQLFATGCLEAAVPEPSLCDDVPDQLHIMKSARWQLERCKSLGHPGDQTCQQTVAVLQTYCDQRG